MIIDLILDRRDDENYNEEYNAWKFYDGVRSYLDIWPLIATPILDAMDYGQEKDVKRELCRYIDEQNYNPDIKNYINSRTWLE